MTREVAPAPEPRKALTPDLYHGEYEHVPESNPEPTPELRSPGKQNPMPGPALAGGPLTNCPSAYSGNWPSEQAMRRYTEAAAEQEKLKG